MAVPELIDENEQDFNEANFTFESLLKRPEPAVPTAEEEKMEVEDQDVVEHVSDAPADNSQVAQQA